MNFTLGVFCAVLSAIFNGSFAALFKTAEMVQLNIHPMVFQLYVCGGVFLSSLLILLLLLLLQWEDFKFSLLGMLAGFLFVLAVSASFQAIQEIGIALAQGIWGGGAMLVAYLWGVVIFGEIPQRLAVSITGLILLVLGVLGIALCETIARLLFDQRLSAGSGICEEIPFWNRTTRGEGDGPVYTAVQQRREEEEAHAERTNNARYVPGVLWACAVALFGGSVLAPMHYVPPQEQGLLFLPSFGIGAMVFSPCIFCVHTLLTREYISPPPLLARTKAFPTGLLSGVIWNSGNLLSTLAIPAISYGVAYPILQCAILMSGVWGIYVFQEITSPRTILVFWCGGVMLLIGGACLAAGNS